VPAIQETKAVPTAKHALETNWTIVVGDIGIGIGIDIGILQALAHVPKLLREIRTRDCPWSLQGCGSSRGWHNYYDTRIFIFAYFGLKENVHIIIKW